MSTTAENLDTNTRGKRVFPNVHLYVTPVSRFQTRRQRIIEIVFFLTHTGTLFDDEKAHPRRRRAETPADGCAMAVLETNETFYSRAVDRVYRRRRGDSDSGGGMARSEALHLPL